MREFELTIFARSSDYSEFRLSDGHGVRTRGLDRSTVDDLVGAVERVYGENSGAQRVFGSQPLGLLGAKLYQFLDGDERWLDPVLADSGGAVLRISADEQLRHLPWELMAGEGGYLAVRERARLLAIRAASSTMALAGPVARHNRPLRVLFMATSPEGVEPELSFETEEAQILAGTMATAVHGDGLRRGVFRRPAPKRPRHDPGRAAPVRHGGRAGRAGVGVG